MSDAIFVPIKEACKRTGLSMKALRTGCKKKEIPHIRIGDGENARFMINLPLFLEQLNDISTGGKCEW